MTVIQDWLLKFLTDASDTLLSAMLTIFVNITNISTALLTSSVIQNAVAYAQELATALLVIKLLFDIYKNYMMNMTGERSGNPPSGYIVRGVAALLIIWSMPFVIEELAKIGNMITSDVASISGAPSPAKDTVNALKTAFIGQIDTAVTATFLALFGSLFALFVGICLTIVLFQQAKRSVEICVMAVIGPVFSINVASEDQSLYKNWFKHLMIVCASQGLQILLLRITFWAVTHGGSLFIGAGPMTVLIVIALLIFTIKGPKFLEQFTYSSGHGAGMGGAMSNMASTAINLIAKK